MAFLHALQGQGGIQNQAAVFNQLQNVAAGQGPNPALAQLQQATGQNIAGQTALMASQRGAGANVGLLGRQAAMQGANIQQQAANQAAILQANQQLAALNQLGSIAGQQVGQQAQATGAYNQFAQGQQQNLLNSIAGQNQAQVSNQSSINAANAGLAGSVMQGQQALMGNVMGGIGSAITGAPTGKAGGGVVEATAPKGPKSKAGQYLMAKGGKVPTLLSPGEKYLTPDQAAQVKSGSANPMTIGKTVPGTPAIGGAQDTYANDTVPAMLQEGGIVIPRSVVNGKNPQKQAIDFVKAVMARQRPSK